MPSTYTLNNGIELIGTGEQSGTWGDTTNTNFELLDVALDGQVTVTLPSAGTSGSPNALAISDGAASDGRNRMIIFDDSSDLGATAYVQLTPNDAEKIIYVRNDLSGSRSIILFQGTYNASNDYELPAGTTAVIYFDGGGAGAVAANVFNNAYFDSLRLGGVSVTAIIDDDTMATASDTNIATSESIKAYVDATAAAQNELSEILANGNTTGGTDIAVSSGDDITFADSSKAIFGAGSDLQIYHDGTNSIIKDAGTGNLKILGTSMNIQSATEENYIEAVANGHVKLFYDAAEKLATESGGVNITGTLTSDGLTVDTTSGDLANFTLSRDTGSANLKISSPESNRIDLDASTTSDSMSFSTNGNERIRINSNGDITFYDTSGNASFVYDESAGSTFNENGDNKDFRVESDTDSHMLFMDASLNQVRIGSGTTNAPSTYPFISYAGGTSGRSAFVHAAGDGGVVISGSAGGSQAALIMGNNWGSNGATFSEEWRILMDGTYDDLVFKFGGSSTALNLSSAGQLTTYYGSTFNENGGDYDFRVESDGNANMLFVDAGNNAVGVGSNVINTQQNGTDNMFFVNGKTTLGSPSFGAASRVLINNAFGGVDYNGLVLHNPTAITAGRGTGLGFRAGSLSNANLGGMYVSTTNSAGTTANMAIYSNGGVLSIDGTAASSIVVNNGGIDTDFRVESDNNTHAFFVDAQYGNVGIKRTSPSYDLDVNASFRTVYSVPAYTSTTGTGASSDYWKLGTVSNLVGSRSLKIRILGTSSYSPGNIAGETTILFRANNSGTTTNGTFWSETSGNNHVAAVAWKQTGTNDQFDIWVKWASSFAGTDIFVETAGQWVFDITNTGSTSQPSGSTTISPRKANYVGDRLALNLQSSEVAINDTSSDMDFRVESNANSNAIFMDGTSSSTGFGTTPNGSYRVDISGAVRHSNFAEYAIGQMSASSFYYNRIIATAVGGGARYFEYGIADTANTSNGAAWFALSQDDGNISYTWYDNSGVMRTSTSSVDVGGNGGTVVGTQTSDERLKTIEEGFEYGIETIKALQPIAYRFTDDSDSIRRLGFGAQTTQGVVPEAVYDSKQALLGYDTDPNDTKIQTARSQETKMMMDGIQLVPVLTKALQEAITKIETLEAKVTALENA